MVSQISNTNLASQAVTAGRLNAGVSASENGGSLKDQFRNQLGSDSVKLSTQNIGTASVNVSNAIKGDGTKAFADQAEPKAGVKPFKGYQVKAIGEETEREDQRKGHQENMKRAGILNGFIDRITAAINGE